MSSQQSPSELADEIQRLCQEIDARGREYWWIKPAVAAAFERGGYHLLPRHFYSPIVDPATVAATDFEKESYPLHPLAFSEPVALELLNAVAAYAGELDSRFPVSAAPGSGFFWDNPFFTGLDACALYTVIRTTRPHRIVEIGSGFSTGVALGALEMNGHGRLSCVEPYPTPKLLELSDRIEIIQSKVQAVPADLFSSLESGDILFIDSSHVSCLGSDVNYEIFDILPNLSNGVVVHFHDIFLPFEYPRDWVADRRWYWNEQYLLYAFLRMNDSFTVWMPNWYMIRRHAAQVSAALPFLGERAYSGVSFWMRKIR